MNVRVEIVGYDETRPNRPAELIESDLVSWLEDEYGLKAVKVTITPVNG